MSLTAAVDRYRRELAGERLLELAEEAGAQQSRVLTETSKVASNSSRSAAANELAADEISRMAAVADWALPSIVEHLASAADHLGGIEEMLANQTETAAAEFYRRGCYALTSGWLEEAERDLAAAVDAYPYNPRSWFSLGMARQRIGSNDDLAAEAYNRCARYAARLDGPLAARAVLLASFLYRQSKQPERSREILMQYADQLEACAELHLALGVHHGQVDSLVKALKLAPELAADARLAEAPGVDEAALTVCALRESPLRRLEAVERMVEEVARAAERAHLSVRSPRGLPPHVSNPSIDALLEAAANLPSAINALVALVDEVREQHASRQAAEVAAARDARAKKAKLSQVEKLTRSIMSEVDDVAGQIRETSRGVQPLRVLPRVPNSDAAIRSAQNAVQHARDQVTAADEALAEAQRESAEVTAEADRQGLSDMNYVRLANSRRVIDAVQLRNAKANQLSFREALSAQMEEDVRRAAAAQLASLEAEAIEHREAPWRRIAALAESVWPESEAKARVLNFRQRHEGGSDDSDRMQSLSEDLRKLLVDPAVSLKETARAGAEKAMNAAKYAARCAEQAGAALRVANTAMEAARVISVRPKRMIVFESSSPRLPC